MPVMGRAWWEHVSKLEGDLTAPTDDRSICGAHDFVATLVVRDLAADGLPRIAPDLRAPAELALHEVDQRFLSYTEPDDDGCTERIDGRVDPHRGWWWRRIPKSGPIHEEIRQYYGHSVRD